jgi:alkyldihydroxyacetonephosphate synthase
MIIFKVLNNLNMEFPRNNGGARMDLSKRSFWGWGYETKQIPSETIQTMTKAAKQFFGLDDVRPVNPPRLEDLTLRLPRFQITADLALFCVNTDFDRAGHTFGKSYRDVLRGLRLQFENPPDYVAYPQSENDIVALLRYCETNSIALIPYGGGSSVVGGVEQPHSDRFRGSISCDMRRFNRILAINKRSRTAKIQAGIYGPELEAGLKPNNLTLRHYPQSFEFSTLGGWIATRAGGHFATLYTHIDDFVQSVRLITPNGPIETRDLPGTGDGPDANRFYIGSEGILGIITEATVRLQTVPSLKSSASVRFAEEADALEAVRQLSQSGLYPSNCRLVSAVECLTMGIGKGRNLVLLLGFESHDHPQDDKLKRALEICAVNNGTWRNEDLFSGKKDKVSTSSTSEKWKENFLNAPYARDYLIRCGLILETFETATTWDNFDTFHSNVLKNTQAAIDTVCSKGIVMWRFTHLYPSGPTVYYTVIAVGQQGSELEQWGAIKKAASDTIVKFGGPITHHHAVGRDHRPWFEQSASDLDRQVLSQVKSTLDPKWIMNPEVLILKND